ncbi:uncharacterized protein DEA37_0008333 [Paragonimus westermani]|uniref:Ig-like domain-containing protein n=1 Tax=Paragonimus westermani TaxID=34504 RepID=A0A5J4NLZ0_9TREM|nr:uncharacterized protein DEA37_0008333 [Paragonimus westermani]
MVFRGSTSADTKDMSDIVKRQQAFIDNTVVPSYSQVDWQIFTTVYFLQKLMKNYALVFSFIPESIQLHNMLVVAYFVRRSSILLSLVHIWAVVSSSADFSNTEDASSPVSACFIVVLTTVLPEFVSLPQTRLYVDPHSTESVQIICLAWPPPPLGQVAYYYYPAAINRLSSTATTAPLHPVPVDWLDRNRSALVLTSKELMRRLTFHDLHCLASTQFGAVLSPPFQVVLDHTRLETKAVDQLVIQNIPINGTAVLQCNRPHLGPIGPSRFLVNGSALPDIPDKFLMFTPVRPANASVLLIRNFQHADHGVYGCVVVDPLFPTAPLWMSSVRYQLRVQDQISIDTVNGQGDFVQSHTSSGRNFLQNGSPKVAVDVMADENVTLYCVPPPAFASHTVRIGYNSTDVLSAKHQFIPLFGVLHITHLSGDDTGSYWCSAGNWTATVHLRVTRKPRVSIIPAVIHKTVGQSAQLSCTGSERIPFAWYHNGVPLRSQISSGAESSFHLEALSSSMAGVYQCVQQTTDADWISAQAVVKLNGTRLLRRSDFKHFQDTSLWNPLHFSSSLVITPSRRSIIVGCLSTQTNVSNISVDTLPTALYDLFPGTGTLQNRLQVAQLLQLVRLRWRKDGVSLQLPGQAYASSVEPHQFTLDLARSQDFGVYECAVYTDCAEPHLLFSHALYVKSAEPSQHLSVLSATPVGDNLAVNITWSPMQADFYRIQFRHKSVPGQMWSKPVTIDELVSLYGQIPECCSRQPICCQQTKQFYFTSRKPDGLEPGHQYKFRVMAIITNADQHGSYVLDKSRWSQVVSFEHISKVAPVFTETERLPDGSGIVARWTLVTSAVGFPIDHFLLLYRKQESQSDGKIAYDPFQHVLIPGANTRKWKLQNLEPGKGYQLVIYGVHTPPGLDAEAVIFKGGLGGRKITQFSNEVFVEPLTGSSVDPGSVEPETHLDSVATSRKSLGKNTVVFNSAESNRLMFLILGALAGMLLIVMFSLIILCVCRQMRKRKRVAGRPSNWNSGSQETYKVHAKRAEHPQNSATFMLEHLGNPASVHSTLESQKLLGGGTLPRRHQHPQSGRCSATIYPQPPPMSPPPPPPRHANCGDLVGNMPAPFQSAQMVPPHSVFHSSVLPISAHHNGTNNFSALPSVDYTYWAAMTGSHYSGPPGQINCYYLPPQHPTVESIDRTAQFPPAMFGLKREPPSGGSVHDGTDTETDAVDQMTPVGQPGVPVRTHPVVDQSIPVVQSRHGSPPAPIFQSHANPNFTHQYNPQLSQYNPGLDTPPPSETLFHNGELNRYQRQQPAYGPVGESVSFERHSRRRRRRLTADNIRDSFGAVEAPVSPSQPLMTSSPVNHDISTSRQNNDVVHVERRPMTSVFNVLSPANPEFIASRLPHHTSHGNSRVAYPDQVGCQHRLAIQTSHTGPPEYVAYRNPSCLSYGIHNPASSSHSVPRRDGVIIMGDPPRVRDYSEYGIPNINGTGGSTDYHHNPTQRQQHHHPYQSSQQYYLRTANSPQLINGANRHPVSVNSLDT